MENNIDNLNKSLDKLENRVLQFLLVCDKNLIIIDNNKFKEKFYHYVIRAFEIFSKLIKNNLNFLIIF